MRFKEFAVNEDALADKAKKSGISRGTLKKVYNRGVAAWKTGHRPGTTPAQCMGAEARTTLRALDWDVVEPHWRSVLALP